ncbi:MAG: hypothetical protein ABEJ28_05630 [Salinigranum sp.]
MSLRSTLAVALLVGLLTLSALGAAASWSVGIDSHVEVPKRTVSTQWGNYAVTQVGRADTGDRIAVSVSAPTRDYYQVRLIDRNTNQIEMHSGRGDARYGLNLRGLPSGTYAVAVTNGTRSVYAVEPLVVRRYAVTQDAPGAATAGDTLDVSASISRVDSGTTPTDVQVIFGNDSTTVDVTATKRSSTEYAATVSTDGFAPGTYTAYTVVHGGAQAFGHPEVIGLSDATTVRLSASGTATPAPTATTTTVTPTTATPMTSAPTSGSSTSTASEGSTVSGADRSTPGDGASSSTPSRPTETGRTATPGIPTGSVTPASSLTVDATPSGTPPPMDGEPAGTTADPAGRSQNSPATATRGGSTAGDGPGNGRSTAGTPAPATPPTGTTAESTDVWHGLGYLLLAVVVSLVAGRTRRE